MSNNRVLQPDFKASFLLPKYWLTWLAVFILYTVSWLPYRVQLCLGRGIGRMMYKLAKKRVHVARTNIALSFPEKSPQEQDELVYKNFENTGIALLETGIGWWWPNWRIKRKMKINGLEHITNTQKEGKGALLLTMHNLSIETVCRGMGVNYPTIIFYRPNNNQLMEYFQFHGRNRSNKYMLDKHDVKGLMRALRSGESCVYLPDQDYGRNKSLFVPFFGTDAATTTATLIFAKQPNINVLLLTPTRNDDGSGYTINVSKPWENFPTGDSTQDLTLMNKEIENSIRQKPEQYMWMHRRFKTRPNENDPSLY